MKTELVSAPPEESCHRISTQVPTWKAQLRELVRNRLPIKTSSADIQSVMELKDELDASGYKHQVLHSDVDRHFLVPANLVLLWTSLATHIECLSF